MIDVLGGISSPIVESGAVAVVGLSALAFKRWRTGLALIVAAAVWLWLCASPAFALLMWQGLANQYPPRPPAGYPHVDAIVLVGGGPVPKRLDQWNATVDPALATPPGVAVALYKANKATVIVATGSYGYPKIIDALKRQGIPSTALRAHPETKTTHQDSTHSRNALNAADSRTILLVTTEAHTPRTVAAFRKQGFTVIAAPAHRPAWVSRWPHSWWPRRSVLYLSRAIMHEYIGLVYYRLRGWAVW